MRTSFIVTKRNSSEPFSNMFNKTRKCVTVIFFNLGINLEVQMHILLYELDILSLQLFQRFQDIKQLPEDLSVYFPMLISDKYL